MLASIISNYTLLTWIKLLNVSSVGGIMLDVDEDRNF